MNGHADAQESSGIRATVPGAAMQATTAGARFDASVLRQIETQLAEHIGPLAQDLVKRAAASAASMDELVQKLASELDAESLRHQFVEACWQIQRTGAS